MLKYLLVFLIGFGCVCLLSCSQSHIFVTSKYKVAIEDKLFALDSFEVVKVIDNRRIKDSIIGIANSDKDPLIIDKPLPDYLKAMFNVFIYKLGSTKKRTPVTVTVDDFFADRSSSWFHSCVHNKYSYVFEYPNGSVITSLRIEDSILDCDNPSEYEQKRFIIRGIREASNMFTKHIKKNPVIPYKASSISDTVPKLKVVDTLSAIQTLIYNYKLGGGIGFLASQKINTGISLWYSVLYNVPGSKWEQGIGVGASYLTVPYSNNNGAFTGRILVFDSYAEYKYNFSNDLSGMFLKGKITLGTEYESPTKDYDDVRDLMGFIGRLDETVGYNLGEHFSLNAGIYQQGILFSRLLPTDWGFCVSLTITGQWVSSLSK